MRPGPAFGSIKKLPPAVQKATTSRTMLAEAILKLADQGERDRERLIDGALDAVIARNKTDAVAASLPLWVELLCHALEIRYRALTFGRG
jgi:hypothetical protein